MTNYDLESIARGTVEVDTSSMSPMEALKIGLAVQDYKDAHGIDESFKIDYTAVGEFMSNNSKSNRENSHIHDGK